MNVLYLNHPVTTIPNSFRHQVASTRRRNLSISTMSRRLYVSISTFFSQGHIAAQVPQRSTSAIVEQMLIFSRQYPRLAAVSQFANDSHPNLSADPFRAPRLGSSLSRPAPRSPPTQSHKPARHPQMYKK